MNDEAILYLFPMLAITPCPKPDRLIVKIPTCEPIPDPPEIQILPISERYIKSYHACLDAVARERLYLGFVEVPPSKSTRGFVRGVIAGGFPMFLAVVGERVVGWCDVIPMKMEGFTHCGELGMGVRHAYRRRGIGRRLLTATLSGAGEIGLERVGAGGLGLQYSPR